MQKELEDLTDNIEILYKKLSRLEGFLKGITVGMAVLLVTLLVILFKLIVGG